MLFVGMLGRDWVGFEGGFRDGWCVALKLNQMGKEED